MNDSRLYCVGNACRLRPLALTIPAVIVFCSPYGLPMASTHSPRRRASEFPIGMVGRSFASILISATSVVGSVPMTLASNVRLSFSVTFSFDALSTTWWFVTI